MRNAAGTELRIGDVVRVIGLPTLGGMHPDCIRESWPVFEYLVGKYKRIAGFNDIGQAELSFRISKGQHKGLHTVWIEPELLRVRKSRHGTT